MKKIITLFIVAGLVFLLPQASLAVVTGVCSNCHTMHNSQDGIDFNNDAQGPNSALTIDSCLGCHQGGGAISTDSTTNAPLIDTQIYSNTGGTAGTVLAGGSFYWVTLAGDDTKGHNVISLGSQDSLLGKTPPGWNSTFAGAPNTDVTWVNQLTCAGTYGCHGDHAFIDPFAAISGAHHMADTGTNATAPSTVGESYRFLNGIKGKEDSDWELTVSNNDHNQYYGTDRTNDTQPASTTHTISYLCAECHTNFHSGSGNNGVDTGTIGDPWLRHPTDYDMNNEGATSEYASYITYSTTAPVASNDLTSVKSDVTGAGDAIVMCMSCHRAHGTPYNDLLRWSYSTCDTGTPNTSCGCFECHTTKD